MQYKKFLEGVKDFSKKLAEEEDIIIVSHHDADGITACAIILKLFKNLDRNADFKIIKQLDSSNIKEIDSHNTVIFTDLGSGHLELIEKNIKNF